MSQQPKFSAEPSSLRLPAERIAADRLEGAQEVARELGWPVHRVYHTIQRLKSERRDLVPMWKEPGVGIVSTRSAIADYHRRRAAEAMEPESHPQTNAA
jgi:hypothetical protein